MLDVKTLFVVMIATSLLLAGSMAVAVGMRFRDGVGKWTGSLMLQAVTFVCFSLRGGIPDLISIVFANCLLALSFTLQAAAILEFFQKKLHVAWHIVPILIIGIVFTVLISNVPLLATLAGLGFGAGLLVLALLLQRQQGATEGPARWLLIVGYLVGGAGCFFRALVATVDPAAVTVIAQPGIFQGISFLIAFAVILVTSVGFLLLQKERAEEIAQKLAVTDPLTGTFNRRTFLELADKEISRAQRATTPLSLVMIDLDHFKKVNDEYGHLAGDEVLKRSVAILQGCLRREDLLVRFGGEEFCILLPNVSLDAATQMAERIRESVERAEFTFNGHSIPVTISLGVASMLSKSDTTALLIGRADEALYSAKRTGRNRAVAYPENSTFAMLMRSQQPQKSDLAKV